MVRALNQAGGDGFDLPTQPARRRKGCRLESFLQRGSFRTAGTWQGGGCYALWVSPTIFRAAGLRFFFFSREEARLHVHALGVEGEAKFWLEPRIELARNYGLSERKIREALRLVEEHQDEIRKAWQEHFGS